MALKNTSDPAAVARALTDWLPGIVADGQPVTVTDVVVPQSSGMSSETVLLQAAWQTADGEDRSAGLVLRIQSDIALFPDTDIAREAAVMRAVGKHSSVPVPDVIAHEETGDVLGKPFLLMNRLYGEVPADDPPYPTAGWVTELSDDQRAAMYDAALRTIAAAQIDPVEADLVDVLGHQDLGETVLEQEMEHWKRTYEWAKRDGASCPTIDAAMQILEPKRPEPGRLTLSWGDSRFGNMMFGPNQEITGAFDWEMASLGSPEYDLGLFLFTVRMYAEGMGLPPMGGFPDRDAAIARYAELVGGELGDMDWYEAWAGVKCCTLVMRIGNLLIDMGALPADATMPFANPTTTTLALLLGLPAPSGESGTAEIFSSRGNA